MKAKAPTVAEEVRCRLLDLGGKMSHDLGLGRIVGQILTHLYLQEREASIEAIGRHLGLSKAAVSIATRQLESFGLVRRVWVRGDRKLYYRTADNIAVAIQQGVISFARQKLQILDAELGQATALLKAELDHSPTEPETQFLYARTRRAIELKERVLAVLDTPLLRLFVRT